MRSNRKRIPWEEILVKDLARDFRLLNPNSPDCLDLVPRIDWKMFAQELSKRNNPQDL